MRWELIVVCGIILVSVVLLAKTAQPEEWIPGYGLYDGGSLRDRYVDDDLGWPDRGLGLDSRGAFDRLHGYCLCPC